jgi:hypothetical protein
MPTIEPVVRYSAMFDTIFATDLVYERNCHTLCGDAHCCHFRRYKGEGSLHQLPLLPGEYEYMQNRGYLSQYKDPVRRRTLKLISSRHL